MSAFFTKMLQWFISYLIRYGIDHVTAWEERRKALEVQKKKDEATKIPYDEAIKNGTKEDIIKATKDRINS